MIKRLLTLLSLLFLSACMHDGEPFHDSSLESQKSILSGKTGAIGIKRLIFFGDSFTDNEGRLLERTNGLIPTTAYYWKGRFSNGPVWADYVTQGLKLPALNYAMAGARVRDVNAFGVPGNAIKLLEVPGAPSQMEVFSQKHAFNSDDLVMIWFGSNDYLFYADSSRVSGYVDQVMDFTRMAMARGAKNILVFTLIPFDNVPLDPKGLDGKNFDRKVLEDLIDQHNRSLKAKVQALAQSHPEVKLHTISPGAYIREIRKNAVQYGLTDLQNPCFQGGVLVGSNSALVRLFQSDKKPLLCDNPRQHLFWDKAHPTTVVHCLAATHVLDELEKLGYARSFDSRQAEQVCMRIQDQAG